MAIITGGKTTATANAIPSNNYKITPLITKGDQVALLTGDPLAATPTFSTTQLFTMEDTPDGLGLKQINGLNYVWMNHELTDSTITPLPSGQIKGARVSLFVFDSNWNVLGGKNLIERVNLGTKSYSLNTTSGLYVNNANATDTLSFYRFCSGYLAETGFFDSTGRDVPLWLMGEEGGNTQYGLATTPDGTATVIAGLGRFSKENVVSHRNYRAANSDWTVLISTEDNADGEVYMYVGKQTPANPNGLWSEAGADGSNFALYALRVKNSATGTAFVDETMPEDQVLTAEWVEVPDNIALDTATNLSNWVNGTDAGVVRSTNFQRVEDITNSTDPNTFYFTTTGSGTANPNGKVHQITVDIDPISGKPKVGTFENLIVSGTGKASRYDNLVADKNGNLVIQTDGNTPNEVGLKYNISANANNVGNDQLEVMYQTTGGESSGVIEANPNAAPGQSSYLFDVQSSGKGQLLLLEPTTTTPADTIKPTLSFPLDNSGSDLNSAVGTILLNQAPSNFQFQLSDQGGSINDASVTSQVVTISKNGVQLNNTTGYTFSYDSASDRINIGGNFTDGKYQINISSGIRDLAGNTLDPVSFNIDVNTSLNIIQFQQGSNGYQGTTDTYLQAALPTANNASATQLNVDGSDGGGQVQSLLRFDNIFGGEAGQIPLYATIESAKVVLQVTNAGESMSFYQMLQPWSDTANWNTFTDGIQANGIEAASTPDFQTAAVATGVLEADVTKSLQAWLANPQNNNGWAFLPKLAATNGVDFSSAEGTNAPILQIQYNLNGVNQINGTAGIDSLRGSLNNDIISGLDGNDDIRASRGNDLLKGGLGDDFMEGGSGNDILEGEKGNDRLFGDFGQDFLYGGSGNDSLGGGDNTDYLSGGTGRDTLQGGAGNDFFYFNGINEGYDKVDFAVGQDKILLSAKGFGGGLIKGDLNSSQFTTSAAATTAEQRVIYDSATGKVFFDADGNGTQIQHHFATLNTNLSLTSASFTVVA